MRHALGAGLVVVLILTVVVPLVVGYVLPAPHPRRLRRHRVVSRAAAGNATSSERHAPPHGCVRLPWVLGLLALAALLACGPPSRQGPGARPERVLALADHQRDVRVAPGTLLLLVLADETPGPWRRTVRLDDPTLLEERSAPAGAQAAWHTPRRGATRLTAFAERACASTVALLPSHHGPTLHTV